MLPDDTDPPVSPIDVASPEHVEPTPPAPPVSCGAGGVACDYERVTATLEHTYQPRGTAKQLFQSKAPEILVSGPAGTGKSRGCLEKVLALLLANPGARALVLRKTNASLTSTTLVTWREHVAKEGIAAGLIDYYGGSASEPPQYRFANGPLGTFEGGSRMVIGGLDKATKIMSSEYDLIYVAEATEVTVDDWQMISTRLRNGRVSFQQLIADCNPDKPTHWLLDRSKSGDLVILYSQHWENPRLYAEVADRAAWPEGTQFEEHNGGLYALTPEGVAYLGKLRALTGVRRQRLLDGKWVAAEGLVYENWDPAVHILTQPYTPEQIKDWRRYWVIDFGFRNPFVCQWWAESPDGVLYLYREIYKTGRLVEDHARHMLRLVTYIDREIDPTPADKQLAYHNPKEALKRGIRKWRNDERKPDAIICDHDSEDRATLEKHLGMGTTAANKAVSRGVQAVEKRLEVGRNGRPGLLFSSSTLVELDQSLKDRGLPTCTVDEFGGYVWPGGKKPEKPLEEHPVKENDHGMDNVRYIVARKDLRKRFADRDIFLEG